MASLTPDPAYHPASRTRRLVMVMAIVVTLAMHAFAYFLAQELPPQQVSAPIVFLTQFFPAPETPKPKPKPAAALRRSPPPAHAEPPADPASGVSLSRLVALAPAIASGAVGAPDATPATAFASALPLPAAMPSLPTRADIAYRLTSSVVDGSATLRWRRDGSRYEAVTTIRADNFFADFLVGTIRQASRGEVTRHGLRPDDFSLTRGSSEPETAEFLRDTRELKTRSRGESKSEPLAEPLQDTQSFLFQMAVDADRFLSPDTRMEVMVTNARKIYRYQFHRIGEETLALKSGPVATWHLVSEAADPEDVYEVWLAPSLHFLPVKLKFHLGKYPMEQTATSISVE